VALIKRGTQIRMFWASGSCRPCSRP